MRKRVIADSPFRRALAGTEPGEVRTYTDAFLIPLDRLHPDAHQPRQEVKLERLAELADSIRARGVLQPILVRPDGDDFVIIAGHRRYQAARMADLTVIPCVVRDTEGSQVHEEALVENLQREDLDPLEEASAYQHLVTTYGYTVRALARQVHKSVGYIHSRLELAQHQDVAAAVQSLNVGVYAARELAKLDPQQRGKLLSLVKTGELDDRGVVEAARAARISGQASTSLAARLPWAALKRTLARLDPHSLTPAQRTRARRELTALREHITRLLEALP